MCLRDWNKALRRAIQKNDLELLHICIENGADIGAQNKKGKTAYDFVKNNRNSRLRALLKQPADKFRRTIRNKNGIVILQYPLLNYGIVTIKSINQQRPLFYLW